MQTPGSKGTRGGLKNGLVSGLSSWRGGGPKEAGCCSKQAIPASSSHACTKESPSVVAHGSPSMPSPGSGGDGGAMAAMAAAELAVFSWLTGSAPLLSAAMVANWLKGNAAASQPASARVGGESPSNAQTIGGVAGRGTPPSSLRRGGVKCPRSILNQQCLPEYKGLSVQ